MQLTEQQEIRLIGKAMVIVNVARLVTLVIDEALGAGTRGILTMYQKLADLGGKLERRRDTTDYRVSMASYKKQCEAYERMQARHASKARHPAGKGLWDERNEALRIVRHTSRAPESTIAYGLLPERKGKA